jgi:selenocysteine lyase/cysteine desulfurase
MTIDVEQVRLDTAGCEGVVHLNNAGSSLPPRPVVDAVIGHLRLEERLGGYEAAAAASERIESTYGSLAELIGAGRDEIAVIENATRAWDMAFYSLSWQRGDRIITARSEYASNAIAMLQTARRHGVRIDVVPDDETGVLCVEALRGMLDERVKLIAITHVPSHNGLVNPVAEVGKVARDAGVLYLLDACQSVGQLPLDVAEIGCDLLCASGRKFLRAPRGTGFLYCADQVCDRLEPPFLDLHAATWTSPEAYQIRAGARRFENWETCHAGKIGLGVAARYALGLGMDAIASRISDLAATLRQKLAGVPGVTVWDRGTQQCALVTFTVAGRDSREIAHELARRKINVSVSVPEYARWDFESPLQPPVVRASVHYYNTEPELDQLCAALRAR